MRIFLRRHRHRRSKLNQIHSLLFAHFKSDFRCSLHIGALKMSYSVDGDKRQKLIQWDEETIAEHDRERGSRLISSVVSS